MPACSLFTVCCFPSLEHAFSVLLEIFRMYFFFLTVITCCLCRVSFCFVLSFVIQVLFRTTLIMLTRVNLYSSLCAYICVYCWFVCCIMLYAVCMFGWYFPLTFQPLSLILAPCSSHLLLILAPLLTPHLKSCIYLACTLFVHCVAFYCYLDISMTRLFLWHIISFVVC